MTLLLRMFSSQTPVQSTSHTLLLPGHPLLEVRCRSLRSLRLKMDHGLLRLTDAAEEEFLLRQLLEWFNKEGCQKEEDVLGLLTELAQVTDCRLALKIWGANSVPILGPCSSG